MPVGDIQRVVTYAQMAEQAGLNVWHFRLDDIAGAELSQQERADTSHPLMVTAMAGIVTNQAQLRAVGWRRVHPLPVGDETLSTLGAVNGLVMGDALPRQATGIATLRTGIAGRANRGRKYLVFPGEADNEVDATPLADYAVRATNYLQGFVPGMTLAVGANEETWIPVIFRPLDPPTSVPITSVLVRDRWATQRRRGSYGTPNPVPA